MSFESHYYTTIISGLVFSFFMAQLAEWKYRGSHENAPEIHAALDSLTPRDIQEVIITDAGDGVVGFGIVFPDGVTIETINTGGAGRFTDYLVRFPEISSSGLLVDDISPELRDAALDHIAIQIAPDAVSSQSSSAPAAPAVAAPTP